MTAARPTVRSPATPLARLVVGALAALASAVAFAQAGRVVLTVGEATSVRGTARAPLSTGAGVDAGDTIVTGADGHVQIRFADGTVVAVAPRSELSIDATGERAVLRLSRGGMRTTTAPAAMPGRDGMQVVTPQATIAVRGTHFQLAICAPDACRESAGGPPAEPGLYGGVYDGTVVATAPTAAATFRLREFFVVPDGGAPRRLIAPPSFLSRAIVDPPLADARQVAFAKVPEFPLDRYSSLLQTVRYPYQSTEDLAFGEPVAPPLVGLVGSDEATLEFVADLSSDANRLRFDSLGRLVAIDTGALVASLGTASLLDTGSSVSGGANLNWGRWAGPGSTITQQLPNGDVVHNDGGNLHYVYGVVATDLPTAGIVEYTLVGGTQPTDSGTGATGTLLNGGRVAINFGIAQVSVNGLQVGFTNATYTMSGTASLVGPLFSTSGIGATGTCVGAACQALVAANFAGFLAGPGAPGLGLDYFFNTRIGVIEGAAGYRRCAGPGNC